MKVYRSKIDHWLWITILLIVVASIAVVFCSTDISEWGKLSVILLPSILPIILLMGDIWLHTKYMIDEEKHILRVKCGVLYDSKYKIDDMTEIRQTKSLLNAPALSFDRLRINFGERKTVLVSPKNQDDFIKHLCRLNQHIICYTVDSAR